MPLDTNRQKRAIARRLAWFGEQPARDYWERHWLDRLDHGLADSAVSLSASSDELMTILRSALAKSGIVLEAGCGAGQYVVALRDTGYTVIGIDNVTPILAKSRQVFGDVCLGAGDALNLPLRDGSVDGYVSIGVVEHRVEGPLPFLIEACRVLRAGGKAVITVPAFGPIRRAKSSLRLYGRSAPTKPFYQYGFTARELSELTEEAGLKVETAIYHYAHRLLTEESAAYNWLLRHRGARVVKLGCEKALSKRDGHMVAVVARKP